MGETRDHGGGLDAAAKEYGGVRSEWLDLSTGINPEPYSFTMPEQDAWTALPDRQAHIRLCDAARAFWSVPDGASILPVPGASAAIAQIPRLAPAGQVSIPGPTYNEHAAAFRLHGWQVSDTDASAQVAVHPNNPTGQIWQAHEVRGGLRIIDESFCDTVPERSLISQTARDDTLVIKSFGKFWGLAGIRLGAIVGPQEHLARLAEWLGPWPVSGVALDIGAQALRDVDWARSTRTRLERDAAMLDAIMVAAGARVQGGTTLFRLYHVDNARRWQDKLARHQIWSRVFPYSETWLRLGLPNASEWSRIEAAV